MDIADALPDDLAECQRLLVAAFKEATQHERRVAELEQSLAASTQRATESEQQTAELGRVLDETAASYEALQQEHVATLDELAWYKRWTFGRRRERFAEAEGQGHLFELDPPVADASDESAPQVEAETEVKGHRRRKKRQIDWDKLRQVRHDHDLDDEDKVCSCCGQPMEQIGEDLT